MGELRKASPFADSFIGKYGKGKVNGMKKRARIMNLFYVPAIILFTVFVIYPLIKGVFLSFTNWNGYSQTYKMVGINNYIRMPGDQNVRRAFINTIILGDYYDSLNL